MMMRRTANGEHRRERSRALVAAVLSVAAHLAMTALVSRPQQLPASRVVVVVDEEVAIELELPIMVSPPLQGEPGGVVNDVPAPLLAMAGGEHRSRPDDGHPGRGGERGADAPAVNLAPRDDVALASPVYRSRLERSQLSRVANGRRRRSPENDVVTANPMQLTFVAEGTGRPDPRPTAVSRAVASQRQRLAPSHVGGLPSRMARAALSRAGGLAARRGRAGRPLLAGRARPNALKGRDSSAATERGRAGDTVTSEQEAHSLRRWLLRASTAGGVPEGGRGGVAGGGDKPAVGGTGGEGFVSRPNGSGFGPGHIIDAADARRRSYLRRVSGRIQRRWSVRDFPQQAVLAGKQGYTIVSFVIARDGSISAVRVMRTSGFPSFDQKMRQAVMRAAPFGPLPPDMLPVLHHSHEFVVSNPAVRPRSR